MAGGGDFGFVEIGEGGLVVAVEAGVSDGVYWVIKKVFDWEGKTVHGVCGGARGGGEVGEEMEREEVAVEEDVVRRR